ncbi:MAG: glycogen/starch synthase [Janthinobacterium lividum]
MGLESPNAIVGGLGSVVRDINRNLNIDNENCFVVTMFYPFLRETIKINSLGFFKNFLVDRNVTTEVFLNSKDKQLLFSPDLTMEDSCTIVTGTDKIYEQEQIFLRNTYLNAAVAKFADILNADILQAHAWHTALSSALIKNIYNPLRLEKGILPLKVVSTIHMLSQEQGVDSDKIYKMVGLSGTATGKVNLFETAISNSDHLTTVSLGLIECFKDPETSYGLHDAFKNKIDSTTGITNGIQYASFSPFLKSNLGHLHLPQNFTLQDLKFAKENAKKLLFEYDLIPSSDKPLMLYVGRYSHEKGIKYFEHIIDTWLSLGGQMVLMGALTQDSNSEKIILALQEKQGNLGYEDLRIYTDIQKDQLNYISDEISISKGKAIRFGADWTCIPSEVESCGLVSMESFCYGTPVFTSWVQGLKDMCLPHGIRHPLLGKIIDQNDFNSIMYNYIPDDFEETICDISKQLHYAYDISLGKIFDSTTVLSAQMRMINTAHFFDWRAPNGALEKYQQLYEKLTQGKIQKFAIGKYLQNSPGPHLVQSLVQEIGEYPQQKNMFQYTHPYPFVLCTLVQGKREPESALNRTNLKEETRVYIKDQHIYKDPQQTILVDTESLKKDPNFYVTWFLNKKGDLFMGASCHANFLKSKPGNPHYGYGKLMACGGDAIVEDGKFKYIDNRSGHYQPNLDQFMLALHYFFDMGLIRNDCEIKQELGEELLGRVIPLKEIILFDVFATLNKYRKLP